MRLRILMPCIIAAVAVVCTAVAAMRLFMLSFVEIALGQFYEVMHEETMQHIGFIIYSTHIIN